MINETLGILLIVLIALIAYQQCCRKLRFPESSRRPPYLAPPTTPPSVRLTPQTIQEFLGWVAAVPVVDAHLIREQVALAASSTDVLDELEKALFDLPVEDVGRHLLLLSVLGETRNPIVSSLLTRFIRLPADEIGSPPPVSMGSLTGKEPTDASLLTIGAILQARAVEMLAYQEVPQAIEETLKIAADHPLKVVRVAAIDAYLFNCEHDNEAIERVRCVVREDERMLVGLIRRTKGMDAKEFDVKVQAFYKSYPEQQPPLVHLVENKKFDPPRHRRGFRNMKEN
jgi:hypothetical protein